MLNNDTLSQLKQLKTDIRTSENRHEGTVSGSSGTYGFVLTDDKQQFFLPPQQMQRVFPGDRIDFTVKEGKGGKPSAEVNSLIKSEFKAFCGQCLVRGNAWFVSADEPGLIRQLFLPPAQRKNIQAGDWLACKVSRHPIKDGKAQASVIVKIGDETMPAFPSRYAQRLKGLLEQKFDVDEATAKSLLVKGLESGRPDLSDLPFVTIDAPSTRDMDDALYAARTDTGWNLFIAIADAAALVEAGSALDKNAAKLASSHYLPHFKTPMLPALLSEGYLSLVAGEQRLAIVCQLSVDEAGKILSETFSEAVIQSHGKLSYHEVSDWLANGMPDDLSPAVQDSLLQLHQVSRQRQDWRRQQQLVATGKPEYSYSLDDGGRISAFTAASQGEAGSIVQEAMLATNQAAARMLANGGAGIFTSHGGFRTERLADAIKQLNAQGLEVSTESVRSLEGYRSAIRALQDSTEGKHTSNVLSRFLQRSQLQSQPSPHLGLGTECYLNFTSPIRRYVDLENHRHMKRLLAGKAADTSDEQHIARLADISSRQRHAAFIAERWLKCDFLERNPQQSYPGSVAQMNKFVTTVRLDDTGIEGTLDNRKLKGKFDIGSMSLALEDTTLTLEDRLTVKVKHIDKARRSIDFELVSVDR